MSPSSNLPPSPSGAPPSRRRRWPRVWKGIGIAVLVVGVLLAAGVWLVLNYGPVHRFALEKADAAASQAFGSQVRIRNLRINFSLWSPSVDLYGIRAAGAAPYASPPLLQVDHVHVAVAITSLWRRSWHLHAIAVDHPVIHIFRGPDGRTNIPFPSNGDREPGPDPFSLGIRHLTVRGGELIYNDRVMDLNADLSQVRLEASYNTRQRAYDGTFGYRDGRLRIARFDPVPNDLSLTFHATADGVRLNRVALSAAGSRVEAAVTLEDYGHPRLTADYRMSLDASRARALLKMPELPRGDIEVEGHLRYAAPTISGQPSGLAALESEGSFHSAALALTTQALSVPVRDLRGSYSLDGGTLAVNGLHALVMGGGLQAGVTIRGLGPSQGQDRGRVPEGEARVQLTGAKLEEIGRSVRHPGQKRDVGQTLGALGISGVAGAKARLSWSQSFEHLQVQADATVRAAVAPAGVNSAHAAKRVVPVRGTVHLQLAGDRLTLSRTSFQIPGSSLAVDGTISMRGHNRTALRVQASSANLAELEMVAGRLAAGLGKPLPPQGLAGTARLSGVVSGSLSEPEFRGQLSAADLKVHQTSWRSATLRLDASPDRIQVADAVFEPSEGGEIHLSGRAGLRQWNLTGASPVQGQIRIRKLGLRQFEALTGPLPVEGVLDAAASLQGTLDTPSGQGTARLTAADLEIESTRQPMRSLEAKFEGTGTAIEGTLHAALAGGTIQVRGSYDPGRKRYQAQLTSSGIELGDLQALRKTKLGISGQLSIQGRGQGSVANPAFEATISIPKLTVDRQAITDLRLQASVADHTAHATLTSNAVDTAIEGEATVALAGEYMTTAKVDTKTIPLAPLIAAYASGLEGDVDGQTEVHATFHGPLKRLDAATAEVEIPVLRLQYGNAVQVAAAAPIHLVLANGTVTLESATLAGENTHLTVGGKIPLEKGASLAVRANGTVNLKLLQAFAPDLSTGGELRLNLETGGTLQQPTATGGLAIEDFRLSDPNLPVGLSRTDGTLRLEGNRITITSLKGTVGGGTLEATGGVTLGERTRFDVGLKLNQVRLVYPPTMRETVGGTLTLAGTTNAAALNGRVQVEDVSVTPQFDFTSFLGQLANVNSGASAPGSFAENLKLNVGVTTPNEIHIVSRDFSMDAGANVTVRGTLAQPVVLGRVNLNGGDLIFRGNRYVVQSGTLDFVNPNETQPVVNVSADTTIQQYDLHLRFTGPADNLHTAYTSDPALPPADIINLLAFGETTEASAANPAPGNLGAENLIASAVSGQITDRVQKIAGISQLSVDPVLGGPQQNAGARITIQQRVTGNLFVTISTDVSSTQRNVIEIQYKLSPTVSISGIRKQNGGFGINTRFKHSW